MSNFTKKHHERFQKTAVKLLNVPDKEARNMLAEIEMKEGEDARREIEYELNVLLREDEYKRQADDFYEDVKNIGKYPEDYNDFPVVKKEIFRKYNDKKKQQIKRAKKSLVKNKKLVEKLLLHRIKHKPTRFTPHLIPRGMRGVSAEATMEAERLYYIYKSMLKHYQTHPESHRFGMTAEEKDILKKVETGYFEKKMSMLKKVDKKVSYRKKKNMIRDQINKIKNPKEKTSAIELAKNVWYNKTNLTKKEIKILTKIGYQSTDKTHQVFDFDGKPVACMAYKPEGFKHGSYKVDKRESLHHFSRAFLLKGLNKKTKTLVRISDQEGNERVVDAVIEEDIKGKKSTVAIEFQESHKIGIDRVLDKINPIVQKFNKLVIVCSDKYKPVYAKINAPNIFVVNNFEFKNTLREWKLIKESSDEKKKSPNQPPLTKKT